MPIDQPMRRLVSPGAPLLLFEYGDHEREALPADARQVDPARLGGLDLRFRWIEYRRRELGVWFLAQDEAKRALARRLRIGLFRLHAEHQALRTVLSLLLNGTLTYTRGTPEAAMFEAYFPASMQILGLGEHAGFSAAALQEVISAYQAVVNPDEQALLAERLDQVQRQTRVRVAEYSRAAAGTPAAATLPPPAVERGDRVRVFVSYSHEDAKYLKAGSLVEYVSGGLRSDGFDFWFDERIRGSDLWDDRIRQEMERADIALVLVSQSFLNSRYSQETEIRTFIDAARERGLRIYPVILRKCDWKTQPWLVVTQFQPRDGKTVEGSFRTRAARDGLFLTILEELRQIGSDLRRARG
jgi:hypothetical protein